MKRVIGILSALGLVAFAGRAGGGPYELPPEISRGVGVEGGVVLLWPRIIPSSESPQTKQDAAFVQSQLRAAVARALPGVSVDVRPDPERVCPQKGCTGVAVGSVLMHKEAGCAVVATLSRPGQSEQRLIPMAGALSLAANTVPFREPPESYVTIHDFDRCVDLGPNLELRMAAFEAALREALGVAPAAGTSGQQAPPTKVVIGN